MENKERKAGVLLHPTMLPNEWGIGDLGNASYEFVDLLHELKQSYWQILPLTYPEKGNSPYSPLSSFAGNPLLISITKLINEGFVLENEVSKYRKSVTKHINYPEVHKNKEELLRIAFTRFDKGNDAFIVFSQKQKVIEFSKFKTLYDVNNQTNWNTWLITEIDDTHTKEVNFQIFVQFLFNKQWHELRSYANKKGILIIGDLPIYVSYNSSDVYYNRELFDLDDNNQMQHISGVPPDYFNEKGQVWENPLYNWDKHKQTDYAWWKQRYKNQLEMFDAIRLDHFIGFCRFWSIPVATYDARDGFWVAGPKASLFESLKNEFSELQIIAEDLGIVSDDVEQLKAEFNLPGMHVLHFCLDDDKKNPFEFDYNSITYSGTHDNNTTLGWYDLKDLSQNAEKRLIGFLATIKPGKNYVDKNSITKDMIELAYASTSKLAIIPIQDILNLDQSYRINVPGVAEGNWSIRLEEQYKERIDKDFMEWVIKKYDRE